MSHGARVHIADGGSCSVKNEWNMVPLKTYKAKFFWNKEKNFKNLFFFFSWGCIPIVLRVKKKKKPINL